MTPITKIQKKYSVKRVTSYISWIGTNILQDQVGIALSSVLPVLDIIQLGVGSHCMQNLFSRLLMEECGERDSIKKMNRAKV